MEQAKPWLKLWNEWIHDPKLTGQRLAERGSWSLLLSLAQECAADGYVVKGNGSPMSIDDMILNLHITNREDRRSFKNMLVQMEKDGSLTWNDGCLFVNKFATRQAQMPSETKEAVRERVRRYRHSKKKADVTEKSLQSPSIEKINNTIINKRETVTTVSSLHFSQKSPNLASDVTEKSLHEGLYHHWCSLQPCISHKALTPKMEVAMRSALKIYTGEELCQAMSNYAEILGGTEYRWTYKWTLEDFLHRGLEKFMDGEAARQNYREGGARGKREVKTGSHRGSSQAPTREEYLRSIGRGPGQ